MAKVEAARGYGATVELAGDGFDETVAVARTREAETGATFVHAFEDARVVAGQGTLGLELAGQLPSGGLTVVIPVGGGGLAAGTAIALRALRPEVRIVGVQSAACAPFAGREPAGATIADGIAVKHPGKLTRQILDELMDEVVVVDDEEISQAIVLLLERSKLVAEGAGAAPVAAVLAGRVAGDGPVCALLAGGNIDATTMSSVIRYGMTASGRYLVVALLIPDRPGELAHIVGLIAGHRANVLAIQHHREGRNIGVLETRGGADARDARRGALPAPHPDARRGGLHGSSAPLTTAGTGPKRRLQGCVPPQAGIKPQIRLLPNPAGEKALYTRRVIACAECARRIRTTPGSATAAARRSRPSLGRARSGRS